MEDIKVIGVVGSGQMGSGISQLAAVHGFHVWLLDTNSSALSRATSSISSTIQRLISKGHLTQAVSTEALGCLQFTSNLEELRFADVVIEGILESEDVKKKKFKEQDKIIGILDNKNR